MRQHGRVQNTHNRNAALFHPIENHMPFVLRSAQIRGQIAATPALQWTCGKALTAGFQTIEIPLRLRQSPGPKRILHDICEIDFRALLEAICRQKLAPAFTKSELAANIAEDVSGGKSARIPFRDRSPQRRELRAVLLLFSLQGPQRRADHFAGVLIAPALHLGENETIQFRGQTYVPRRHDILFPDEIITTMAKFAIHVRIDAPYWLAPTRTSVFLRFFGTDGAAAIESCMGMLTRRLRS